MNNNIIHVITSKKNKRVFSSDNYYEIFEWIKLNQDAKIRTCDYIGKNKIMSRKLFLRNFLKFTNDHYKFFILAQLLVPQTNNLRDLIAEMGLKTKYNEFRTEFN